MEEVTVGKMMGEIVAKKIAVGENMMEKVTAEKVSVKIYGEKMNSNLRQLIY